MVIAEILCETEGGDRIVTVYGHFNHLSAAESSPT